MQYPIVKMTGNAELTGRDFVGVSRNTDKIIEITIPYGVDLPNLIDNKDFDKMKFLRIYIKAIQKALGSRSVKRTLDEVTSGINNPAVAIKIVYDYISYGQFVEYKEEEKQCTDGNIDFMRTVERISPLLINDNFVYGSFITKRKRIIHNNYISIVQGNVINHFMEHGGDVLFGSKLKVNVRPILLNSTVVINLKKELEQTFNSRKQNVIRWIIDYISCINISSDKKGKWQYAMIASSFWETMSLGVFGSQIKINKSKYGKKYSLYSISKKTIIKTGSPTQHDVVFEDSNNIFIIDAKMCENENNLLSEDVMGKQFGYYKEAKMKEPEKRVINILLLPTIPEKHEIEGFCDYIIEDPHVDAKDDPDRIVFIYKCSANEMIRDYYYSHIKSNKIVSKFKEFIFKKDVRAYLDARGTSY